MSFELSPAILNDSHSCTTHTFVFGNKKAEGRRQSTRISFFHVINEIIMYFDVVPCVSTKVIFHQVTGQHDRYTGFFTNHICTIIGAGLKLFVHSFAITRQHGQVPCLFMHFYIASYLNNVSNFHRVEIKWKCCFSTPTDSVAYFLDMSTVRQNPGFFLDLRSRYRNFH